MMTPQEPDARAPRSPLDTPPRTLLARTLGAAAAALLLAWPAQPVLAQAADPAHQTVLDAREAARKRDTSGLAAAHATLLADTHPLTVWVDYWQLGSRLGGAQQDDLDAFYARWPGSYLEDRLRNDWLLELGRRGDWVNFKAEYPRFVLKDDRQAACYWLLTQHLDGQDVRAAARDAWLAQRDVDQGCKLLAETLLRAGRLDEATVWLKARLATEANQPRLARQAALLLGDDMAAAVDALFTNPQRHLDRQTEAGDRRATELAALALIRLAAREPAAAERALKQTWAARLPAPTLAWVWASLGKSSALRLQADAPDHFQRAALAAKSPAALDLPDETLAWKARAALRANDGKGRWQQVLQAIDAMSAAEQADPTWTYWKARALQAIAPDSQDGAGLAAEARRLLASIASPLHFYGKLATEDLGQAIALPPVPAALTAAERRAAALRPGLQRALLLIAIGLRSEGVREWNYTIRGLDDRELLAAADLACEREVWDRCINTSERTRSQVDMAQRFPTPFQAEVVARAKDSGVEAAYVYGLIRQESRFITDVRSHAGASGLMQLMPATARWTARKLGIEGYRPGRINEQGINLRLGTGYLKLVLDDFEGSQALAAAGYNAGPSRPRRWRDGPTLDAAAWAENIPFSETRDYVKKVLSNATQYAALLSGEPQSLRARLGAAIGPRVDAAPAIDKDLP